MSKHFHVSFPGQQTPLTLVSFYIYSKHYTHALLVWALKVVGVKTRCNNLHAYVVWIISLFSVEKGTYVTTTPVNTVETPHWGSTHLNSGHFLFLCYILEWWQWSATQPANMDYISCDWYEVFALWKFCIVSTYVSWDIVSPKFK